MNNLFSQSFKDFYKKQMLSEKFLSADKIKQRFGYHNDPIAYINVHINPNHNEVLEVIKDFKETEPDQYKKNGEMDFVRGFFDMKGNLYVWYGTFFHDPVEEFLRKQAKTKNVSKNESFRFAWLKGDNYLTLESGQGARYFQYENDEQKKKLIKRLVTAFPIIEIKDKDGNQNIRTDRSNKAFVYSLPKDKKDSEKSSDSSVSSKKDSGNFGGFKIGDVVEVITNNPNDNKFIEKGMKGKIVSIADRGYPRIGVEFEKKVGHDCQGKAKNGYGWYIASENIKKVSEEKPKPVAGQENTKDLAKIGDTISFVNNYAGGGKVKILAVVAIDSFGGPNKKQYHYVYKSRAKDQTKYTAKKILDAQHIHFIDGKYNIKSVDEPFSSIMSTGNYIQKIIPNPERVEKRPDNLYEPKRKEGEQTYRAYTDRR